MVTMQKFLWLLFVGVLVVGRYAYADTITVYNTVTPMEASTMSGEDSDGTVYARIYYYRATDEDLLSVDQQGNKQPIVEIPTASSSKINRPDRWRYQTWPYPKNYDRQLVFSLDKEDLKDNLSKAEYQELSSVNVGSAKGWSFYIAEQDMWLEGYNAAEWNIVKPLIEAKVYVDDIVKQLVKKTFLRSQDNPHALEQATVRQGNELCEGERTVLALRRPHIKEAVEKLIEEVGHSESEFLDKEKALAPLQVKDEVSESLYDAAVPTIALVGSGGGYRAMLGTVGSLVGAQDTGLFDAASYLVGLSGSTWAIGGLVTRDFTPIQFKEKLITLITQGLTAVDTQEARLIGEALLLKYAYSQTLTTVDVYGALLATQLLGDYQGKRHQIYLSQQVDVIKDGHMPFPLYSATRRGVGIKTTWWEFSPYEVGSAAFGMYIPSWAYGRKFQAGVSIDFAPEQSLGYNLGTFGSAFAAEFKTIYNEIINSTDEPYKGTLKKIVEFIDEKMAKDSLSKFGEKRVKFSWASVHNFMRGMASSPLAQEKELRLVDAGIDFNLPYPLVSGEKGHRKADIIVLLDYSGIVTNSDALKGCENYARENGLPFPAIDYKDIATRAVTVFKDDNNPEVPVIIYLPLVKDSALWQEYIKNPQLVTSATRFVDFIDTFDPVECEQKGFCKTQNFKYEAVQSMKLLSQAEFNFKASFPVIKQAVADWVNNRKRK